MESVHTSQSQPWELPQTVPQLPCHVTHTGTVLHFYPPAATRVSLSFLSFLFFFSLLLTFSAGTEGPMLLRHRALSAHEHVAQHCSRPVSLLFFSFLFANCSSRAMYMTHRVAFATRRPSPVVSPSPCASLHATRRLTRRPVSPHITRRVALRVAPHHASRRPTRRPTSRVASPYTSPHVTCRPTRSLTRRVASRVLSCVASRVLSRVASPHASSHVSRHPMRPPTCRVASHVLPCVASPHASSHTSSHASSHTSSHTSSHVSHHVTHRVALCVVPRTRRAALRFSHSAWTWLEWRG